MSWRSAILQIVDAGLLQHTKIKLIACKQPLENGMTSDEVIRPPNPGVGEGMDLKDAG